MNLFDHENEKEMFIYGWSTYRAQGVYKVKDYQYPLFLKT